MYSAELCKLNSRCWASFRVILSPLDVVGTPVYRVSHKASTCASCAASMINCEWGPFLGEVCQQTKGAIGIYPIPRDVKNSIKILLCSRCFDRKQNKDIREKESLGPGGMGIDNLGLW